MTAVDVADAYAAAGVRLRDACAGLLLPPRANGNKVAVSDAPPDSATALPAAWCELTGGGRDTEVMNAVTIRFVCVPAATPNDALTASVAAFVDAIEATKIPGRWSWSLQAVQIGGVDRDAIVVDQPVSYPATC